MSKGCLKHGIQPYNPSPLMPGLAPSQELCGGEEVKVNGSVRELADTVCADALSAYLPMEQRWLAAVHDSRLAAHRASGRGLWLAEVEALLAMNEEVGGPNVGVCMDGRGDQFGTADRERGCEMFSPEPTSGYYL
jgi:hypothetical protein